MSHIHECVYCTKTGQQKYDVPITTSKAPVTTSKALVTSSNALVTTSLLYTPPPWTKRRSFTSVFAEDVLKCLSDHFLHEDHVGQSSCVCVCFPGKGLKAFKAL